VITKFDTKIGEEVNMNIPIVGMMTTSKFQIEVYVPETLVPNIKIGNDAVVTLDAYENQNFEAKIVQVDPASTTSDGGVPSYKVVLEFAIEGDRIKSGMTASVKILAQKENNVIIIPEDSVIRDGYDNYVIVYNGSPQGEKRKIELSHIVQNGMVGVVSGLSEKDKIADFLNNTK
jgi:multidrug efflux pump subunit AcrA (membrane-fusion protein)